MTTQRIEIGFTGTRSGMTPQQHQVIEALLSLYKHRYEVTVHHGDCVGSDAQVHDLAAKLDMHVVLHPPNVDTYRAGCRGMCVTQILPERPYLLRNEHIVRCANVMLAAPYEMNEVLRSGTWATIRCARRLNRRLAIAWPDGTVTAEQGSAGMLVPEHDEDEALI